MSNAQTIQIKDIIVGERLRKDYGDLSDLDTISEVGLIQPIVLNQEPDGRYHLVAGGRRFAKLNQLGQTEVHHSITCDKDRPGFVFANELPEDKRREIELYENIGRKQMSWQERVLAIEEIHTLKSRRAAIDRETWGLRETGAELGLEFSYVSRLLGIAAELKKPDSLIWQCKGTTEALRWLLQQAEDRAKQQLASMVVTTVQPSVNGSSAPTPVVESNKTLEDGEPLVVPVSRMVQHIDCGKWMMNVAEPESVDHVISDWPYAIDMANLQQTNTGMDVSRVEEQHDEVTNAMNYPFWLQAMYRVLKPGGYCILWYDNVQWNYIAAHAEACGFRVQRWPLVWIKTSPCLNQMAHKNWTKATEFAIVLSKGNAFLKNTQSVNYWSGPRAENTSNAFAKPKGLWQWIFEAVCEKGQTVLDPFAGEGSSTIAAIDFGLRPIALEIDPNHYNNLLINVRNFFTTITKGNVRFE